MKRDVYLLVSETQTHTNPAESNFTCRLSQKTVYVLCIIHTLFGRTINLSNPCPHLSLYIWAPHLNCLTFVCVCVCVCKRLMQYGRLLSYNKGRREITVTYFAVQRTLICETEYTQHSCHFAVYTFKGGGGRKLSHANE